MSIESKWNFATNVFRLKSTQMSSPRNYHHHHRHNNHHEQEEQLGVREVAGLSAGLWQVDTNSTLTTPDIRLLNENNSQHQFFQQNLATIWPETERGREGGCDVGAVDVTEAEATKTWKQLFGTNVACKNPAKCPAINYRNVREYFWFPSAQKAMCSAYWCWHEFLRITFASCTKDKPVNWQWLAQKATGKMLSKEKLRENWKASWSSLNANERKTATWIGIMEIWMQEVDKIV